MVSWTCTNCDGRGKSEVTIIRNGKVTQYDEICPECLGGKLIRNGEPEFPKCEWSDLN